MKRDIAKKIGQEEEKLNKKIGAFLWKAGYAASKPQATFGISDGYEINWPIVDCHTNGGIEKKIQMLNKYKDAIEEYGFSVVIFGTDEYPRISLGFPVTL